MPRIRLNLVRQREESSNVALTDLQVWHRGNEGGPGQEEREIAV